MDDTMTVREAGLIGGRKRREKADYVAMGSLGGKVTRQRHGLAHYAEIGHRGGVATAQRYGREHFQRMGSRGGQRTRELVRKGQASESDVHA